MTIFPVKPFDWCKNSVFNHRLAGTSKSTNCNQSTCKKQQLQI